DAMPNGGTLTLATSAIEHAGERRVALAVTDDGAGMDAETQRRIFEPFFSTKPRGRGTGLGLAMASGFATQAGGDIRVVSTPGRGSTFTLSLPIARVDGETVARPTTVPPSSGGEETILLVEDEAIVRRAARRVLASAGYH